MLAEYYFGLKAFHLICVISWMAGLLYLPRLMVYHTKSIKGGELSETLKIMERRLYRYIMTPAMLLSFLSGICLLSVVGISWALWWWLKMLSLAFLFGVHGFMGRCVRAFSHDKNRYSETFYRFLNEVPTILMIIIISAVVVKFS